MTAVATLPRMRRLRVSSTLSGYIARQYAWFWASFYLALSGVILLVTAVDLLDRMANKRDAGLGDIVQMALLKLPFLLLSDPEVDALLSEQCVRVKIDLTERGGPNARIATEYGVRGIPTMILYNHRGEEIDRIVGGVPKVVMIGWLSQNGVY